MNGLVNNEEEGLHVSLVLPTTSGPDPRKGHGPQFKPSHRHIPSTTTVPPRFSLSRVAPQQFRHSHHDTCSRKTIRWLRVEKPCLNDAAVAQALRTARRGTAAGLSGATCEHYKLLLDDAEALELFTHAAYLLVAAHVPASVAAAALGLSRLTALRKPGGGVRGIATGDTFRRLVSRSLARMFADTFDEATRPYQFALQTRAGTDALSGMLRAAVDLDSAATIVSLDGRSAYDTISRTAFLRKLHAVAPALIPFVRLWYGQQSTYFWWDQDGQRRTIHQGEGCEQGDALAPALYALGQHDALVAADEQLRPRECLAAFLDDVYLVTTPLCARARHSMSQRPPSRPGRASPLTSAKRGCTTAMEALPLLASPSSGPMSGVVPHPRRSAGSLPSAPLSGTRGLWPLTPTLGCSTRCGCCRSSSVRGSSSPCAPRRALITFCAPSRPASLPAMHVATTMLCGDACSRCWVKKTMLIPRSLQHAASRRCVRRSEQHGSNCALQSHAQETPPAAQPTLPSRFRV